jgi:hypothetical protein
MIPISLCWDSQKRSVLVVKEGEVSILNPRRVPAMIASFFGKVPNMVEKAVNIVKGKKKAE